MRYIETFQFQIYLPEKRIPLLKYDPSIFIISPSFLPSYFSSKMNVVAITRINLSYINLYIQIHQNEIDES